MLNHLMFSKNSIFMITLIIPLNNLLSSGIPRLAGKGTCLPQAGITQIKASSEKSV